MKMIQKAGVAAIAGLAGGAIGTAAQAAVIFSDFGPSNTYNCCSGYSINPGTPAAQFMSPGNYKVTRIDMALQSYNTTGPHFIQITLYQDSGGQLGAQLAYNNGNALSLPLFGSTSNSIATWDNVNVDLIKGQKYWVYFPGDATSDSWNLNSVGVVGRMASNQFGYVDGYTLPAFDVIGAPTGIPEPATWATTLIGFGGLAGALRMARRRDRAPLGVA
jgi:hypothetical protein